MENNINILKWYPFEEGASILEIYKKTSILEKIEKNIKLQKCEIGSLKIEGTYDYITMIGTYEYAPTIIEGDKPYSSLLKILKEHLNPNGKILIAVNNRLGIKYFVGAKSEYYAKVFEGIESEIREKMPNLLLKRELEKFIKEAAFENYKFYYPLADYTNTNSIFTDNFLPKSNHSKILYPVNYEEGSIIVYNEINAIKQICDENKFRDFTNSYFVEISQNKIENTIKFVNYNILRKDKYKLVLIMKQNRVEKIAGTKEAEEHIRNIDKHICHLKELGFKIIEEVKDGKIVSEFIEAEELDKKIVKLIKQEKREEAYLEIENWYSYLKERLEKEQVEKGNIFEQYQIDVPKEMQEKMQFIKNGYIDLSFENIFYIEDYLFYDQEWHFENIPLEFILYRAINNLYTYNNKKIETKISQEEMITKFNLDIFAIYFDKLERKIQKEILDEEAVSKYRQKNSKYYIEIEELVENNEKMLEEINELTQRYKNLKQEEEKLKESHKELLKEYDTSKGWKIIRGFRKFLGKE